ncbi:carbohydrate kinase [Marimonas sp. MJW-29]|uniref:Carbohydrate kinase n=1 Tax=Sulfitobacter sediminis TaxID=3234186 RepID=A0ABV3RMA6_9RHOB
MILCCGEALIDMIPVDLPDGGQAFRPLPGGAVFNTAIALGRLGTEVALFSGVSNDAFGTLLADTLAANRVSTDFLVRSNHLTTLAIVHLQDGSASYSFYDENSAGRALTNADLPSLPDSVSALYFGGISLVEEPAADTYATFLADAHRDRLTILDPNVRPGFIRDEVAYRTRIARMIAQSDIVKVSDEDLRWLEPGPDTLTTKARALRGRGPMVVVVTEGAKGATAYLQDTSISVPAPKAKVVDTVGAGDTFNAGFLAGLREQGCLAKKALAEAPADAIRRALTLGARVAAVTVSRAGANPPWASEIEP